MNRTKQSFSGALLLTFVLAVSAYGQQLPATASAASHTPNTATTAPGADAKAEQTTPPAHPAQKVTPTPPPPPPALSASGKAAVKLADKWKDGTLHGESPVTIDGVGRVRFTYGDAMPTVVCAPKGVCAIELEAGEALRGDPHLGDRVRWHLELEYFGDANDGNQTAVLIAKPDFGGLDTDLIITTNRRAYYIRLVSHEQDYMPQVSFSYPADEQRKLREVRDQHAAPPPSPNLNLAALLQQDAAPSPDDKAAQVRNAIAAKEFDFTVTSNKHADRACLRPHAVYEDKEAGSTTIEMQPCVNTRNLPVVLIKSGGDWVKPNNYRYTDGSFVIDQLIDSAVLRIDGKHADIKNEVHIDRVKEEARVR